VVEDADVGVEDGSTDLLGCAENGVKRWEEKGRKKKKEDEVGKRMSGS
jgi:hypothetical protein